MPRIPGLVLTPEQKKIVEAVRAEIERDKPELIAEGLRIEAAMDIATVHLRNAFSLLTALRKNQGMTLTTLAAATGINKSTLSKLENDPEANVTLSTLIRVSEALGHDLQISVTPRAKTSTKPAKAKPTTKPRSKSKRPVRA
jgi:DNA-binding Xre family transcriptional regulator